MFMHVVIPRFREVWFLYNDRYTCSFADPNKSGDTTVIAALRKIVKNQMCGVTGPGADANENVDGHVESHWDIMSNLL